VPRPASLRARLLAAGIATAVTVGIAWPVWCVLSAPQSTVTVLPDPGTADEATWGKQFSYVVDPVVGLRPRRSSTFKQPMVALDNSDVRETVKRRDSRGFLREHDLPNPLDRPAVLVVGDSHVDGIVDTADNLTSLLERSSEAGPRPYYCLNAGCGYYSLWQHVLRLCDLLPQYHPKVVVVVVFLGNDFLDLENPTVPHLDAELRELPGGERTAPETTSARIAELAIPEPYGQAFWQGLNQALLLHRSPELLVRWRQKSAHAIARLERAARDQGCAVVWALLPSFDLALPAVAQGLGKIADEVVRGGANRRVRDMFVGELAAASARMVDLEPSFVAYGKLDLYAIDFHIYRHGHRIAAEALAPVVAGLLER
jgi:hypothetical protein